MQTTPSLCIEDLRAESLRRDHARRHLIDFAKYTYPQWETGRHHKLIADKLEAVRRGEIKRLLVMAPPRHGKSELATVRFPAWYIGRHPERQIITASYGADLAVDFGGEVRNLINEPGYKRLFPGTVLRPDKQAAGHWRTMKGGVYVAAGIGGALTGYGANVAVIDDPIKNEQEADSDKNRERIWRWYNSTLTTRLMPDGAIVLIMTRWHEDDLAGRALKQETWDVLELPAVSGEHSARESALWPSWYSLDHLRNLREKLPARTWSALYQQRPRHEEGAYMRREWFSERYGATLPKCRVYLTSDFAVSEEEADSGREPDFTELGVVGIGTDEKIYVLDWWSGQQTADVWIDAWIDMMKKWKPAAVFGEGGVIRKAVMPFLTLRMRERHTWARLEWISPIKDKAVRGRPFQALASMHRILFPSTPWGDAVVDQCVGFPSAKHDDKFDAMSLFCLAIDQAHPALIAPPSEGKPKDRWSEQEHLKVVNWRTV